VRWPESFRHKACRSGLAARAYLDHQLGGQTAAVGRCGAAHFLQGRPGKALTYPIAAGNRERDYNLTQQRTPVS
jgi:hypothetical protein